MKFMIVALTALTSVNVFAMTLNCSSADGDVSVTAFRYEGGARPPNGKETMREAWNYQGVNVGTKSYVEGAPSGAVYGRLGTFNEKSKITVDTSKAGQKPIGETVYAVQVEAPTSLLGSDSVSVFLLCRQTFATVPRP